MQLIIEILYNALRVFVFFFFMVSVNQTFPPGDFGTLSIGNKLQAILMLPLLACAPFCAFGGMLAGAAYFMLMWDG
jgi:hypothetical protein